MHAWGKKAQGALEDLTVQPITEVHVDIVVLMRIVKHAQQCTHNGSILSGYILGLDIDGRLEITETVPLPAKHEHEDSYNDEAHRAEGDRHQKETLESLLAVSNFDNYHVGAYHVSYMGYFYVDSLVEELSGFFRNEELSKNSIALLYDPIQTTRGSIFLKAFRVSSRYRDAGNEFIPPSDILEELPVKITCNALATAFVRCLRDSHSQAFDNDFQRFEVSAADDVLLMRHLEELAAGTDELVRTQSEFQRYAKDKSVAKQRKELIELMLKRKKQNEEYQMDGKDPLPAIPTELYERPLPDAPPRLYTLLATAQLGQYCDQTEQHVEDSFHKLFATRALHTSQPAPSAEI